MNSNNTTCAYSDIINNILNSNIHRSACMGKAAAYEATLGEHANKTELIRFSRHISLETYFQNNVSTQDSNNITDNTSNNSNDSNTQINSSNMNSIISELSSVTNNNLLNDDSVLVLQLSSIIDNLLKDLSPSEQKIYLYRYFFMYSIEDIANLCKTQTSNVQKALTSNNNRLKALIQSNNLICDNKSLLLSMSDIDDSYLLKLTDKTSANKNSLNKNNEQDSSSKKRRFTFSRTIGLNILFASTIVILAILNIAQFVGNKNSNSPKEQTSTEDNFITPSGFDKRDAYITINGVETINMEEILKYRAETQNVDLSFSYTTDIFSGRYHSLTLVDDIPLKDYIGEEITELKTDYKSFYRLKGSDSNQYIIKSFDDKYTLYYLEIIYFTDTDTENNPDFSVPYQNIFKNFYGLTRSTEIKEISVTAANYDSEYADYNTKKVINEEFDINNLFDDIRTMVYNGKNVEDLCNENNISLDLIWSRSVQLTITLYDGTAITSLHYYPDKNVFIDTNNYLVYEAQSGRQEYISEMLRFNNYFNVLSSPESWNIHFSCHQDTEMPETLILSADCDPSSKITGLYIGSEYTIEKLENDKWVTPPTGISSVTYPFTAFDKKIATDISNRYYLHIANKYDTLEPGTYRLNLTVYDSNSLDPGNPQYRDYSVKFTIN